MKRLILSSRALAFVVAGAGVFCGLALSVDAQQGAAGARKKVLFLTYPGVGAPGSHGHPSLPAAEQQAVEYGKAGGFDVTTLKGYEPGVGRQDVSFLTAAYLNQWAAAEGLDLEARRGNPAGLGLHNKMVLVHLAGEAGSPPGRRSR